MILSGSNERERFQLLFKYLFKRLYYQKVLFLCLITISKTAIGGEVTYSNDFQGPIGGEWSATHKDTTPSGRNYFGPFSNGTVTLSLSDLPERSKVSLSFELFIIRTWDGNSDYCCGPDVWSLRVDGGPELLRTTFSNTGHAGNKQSYPNPHPGGSQPALTGASAINTLGFSQDSRYIGDSIYTIRKNFVHSSSELTLHFSAAGLAEIEDESWGLGSVKVVIEPITPGTITTVAGNGTGGYSGDGLALETGFAGGPYGLTLDTANNLYITDLWAHRVLKVSKEGFISTVAGTGEEGFSGDGGKAMQAMLDAPRSILAHKGNLFIADQWNHRIREVSPEGMITTFAGSGPAGRENGAFSGENGPATFAHLFTPTGMAMDSQDNLYITDWHNWRVRKVDQNGIITTVAGNGLQGYSGDGGMATQAMLNGPASIAVDLSGNLFFTEFGGNRVRKVSPEGIITTLAGTGRAGFSGDGGEAAKAELKNPTGLALDPSGAVFIADHNNHRIRRVGPDGIITTVVGTGQFGYGGDGGPSLSAMIHSPEDITLDAEGSLYIADRANHRVRKVWFIATPQSVGTLYGDIDNNGTVSVSDVQLLLRIYLGLESLSESALRVGDTRPKPGENNREFGDGKIQSDDLVWLLHRMVGLISAP